MARSRADIGLLFATRIMRLFAYGFVSVVLVLYLAERGLDTRQVGLLFTLTLVGDAAVTLWITTAADRVGRRRMLMLGAGLMLAAGVAFIVVRQPILLMVAAIIGVISPSGNEIGPFLSIEQAGLSQLVPSKQRTGLFAWYNLAGSFATATGALAAGFFVQALQESGWSNLDAYRAVIAYYALAGLALILCFLALSRAVEPPLAADTQSLRRRFGLTARSRPIILRLSLFSTVEMKNRQYESKFSTNGIEWHLNNRITSVNEGSQIRFG